MQEPGLYDIAAALGVIPSGKGVIGSEFGAILE